MIQHNIFDTKKDRVVHVTRKTVSGAFACFYCCSFCVCYCKACMVV